MTRVPSWTLLALMLVFSTPAGWAKDDPKPKKPKLELRSAPRMGVSPASILFTAELKGGEDLEEFYCPSLEWDWDDGSMSTHEPDCAPFEPGTPLERRFTAQHVFSRQGSYTVKVTMSRADKVVASSRATVTIRPGLGDFSPGAGEY